VEEVINHICGTCGDAHPSLITFPALLIAFGVYFSYIKCKVKSAIIAFAYTLRIPGTNQNN
jgi:hypothetical protein